MGEHGDSEVLAWSTVSIAGISLQAFAEQTGHIIDTTVRSSIDEGVRRAAYRIIAGKGYTAQGIGAALARIVRVVRDDEGAIHPLSGPATIDGHAVCLSLPRVLGRSGIGPALHPQLTEDERTALSASARILVESMPHPW